MIIDYDVIARAVREQRAVIIYHRQGDVISTRLEIREVPAPQLSKEETRIAIAESIAENWDMPEEVNKKNLGLGYGSSCPLDKKSKN